MSYKPTDLDISIGQYSLNKAAGYLNTNDYLTFTAITALSGATLNNDELTLPAGQYLIEASLAADRTLGDRSECEYRLELDGVLVGTQGALDYYASSSTGNISCDSASAEFEIATGILKVKITSAASNGAWASTASTQNCSSVLIRRRY